MRTNAHTALHAHLHLLPRSDVQTQSRPRVIDGDIYGSGPHGGGSGFGVGRLRVGAYVIAMRVRAVVQAAPRCVLSPVRDNAVWSVGKPREVPDVILPSSDSAPHGSGVRAEMGAQPHRLCGAGLVALPVLNSGARGWLRNVTVRAKDHYVDARVVSPGIASTGGVGVLHLQAQDSGVDVAPGQLRLVPVQLTILPGAAKVSCPFGTTIELRATADRARADLGPLEGGSAGGATGADRGDGGDGGAALTLTARVGGMQCRRPDQSIICTHLDHDGSVGTAALLRPRTPEGCDPTFGCPAIVTLHGTSRPVRDSADAYKYKPAGDPNAADFTFGAERYWVVAPTRHGAHNWEQGGHLAALAALDALAHTSRTEGVRRLPSHVRIDNERVLFCGHSMGGHGAWAAAVHAASRALGVASVSGWTRKETCTHRRTALQPEPREARVVFTSSGPVPAPPTPPHTHPTPTLRWRQ